MNKVFFFVEQYIIRLRSMTTHWQHVTELDIFERWLQMVQWEAVQNCEGQRQWQIANRMKIIGLNIILDLVIDIITDLITHLTSDLTSDLITNQITNLILTTIELSTFRYVRRKKNFIFHNIYHTTNSYESRELWLAYMKIKLLRKFF